MKYRTSDEIRQVWLEFFKERGHFEEPSASLIPQDDPTLLWINAGVAALKKYFDGTVTPSHRRIVNAQKSLRTNDIENVGKTSRHHTFFEMLGNFSIGDYFRDEVIPWAFDLLTNEKYFGLDLNRLYITHYPDDIETRNLWIKCGVSEDHLIPSYDNFWEIGEGPCGPDTEIHYDRGEEYDPEHLGPKMIAEDIENDRYIEVWNIVFSQFNAKEGLERKDYPTLPRKNIDTGCSLERLACIIQGVETNYETDFFLPIIKEIEKHSKLPYEGENKFFYRVIADHIRSLVFTLADGASFSNEGRGYVLRRLLRRASKYAKNLGLKTGFLSSLVKVVINAMHSYYPYLDSKMNKIEKMILSEEEKFSKTLNNGEKLLKSFLDNDSNVLSGDLAFKLSDTFGFPIELTVEIALAKGKVVDIKRYQELLKEQKEKARASRNVIDSFGSQNKDLMEFSLPSVFTYEEKIIKAKVIGCFENNQKTDEIKEEGIVIFDKTNFYAESGGQIPDTGFIVNKDSEAEVYNVLKAPLQQHMLFVKVNYGSIKVGDTFELMPDFNKRELTKKNHSCTHLLQAALKMIVDPNIQQQGSFVSDSILRFDFNLDRKVTHEELHNVEKLVNQVIFENIKSEIVVLDKEQALKTSATHLFNEKYGDKVRVVSFGDFSKEFCAGTHVSQTGEIGLFSIISEQAISAGVRRITGCTSLAAYEFLKEKEHLLSRICEKLSLTSMKDILMKIDTFNKELFDSKKAITKLENKISALAKSNSSNQKESINGNNFYFVQQNDFSHNQLVDLITSIKNEDKNSVIFVTNKNSNGKVDVAVGVGDNLVAKFRAGQLVRSLATMLNGSGGGKNDIAFGGVPSLENIEKCLAYIKEFLNN